MKSSVSQPHHHWTTDKVKARRDRTNAIRDRQNFSGKGRYTPDPGRGPYPWRVWGASVPQPVAGEKSDLSGTEPEGWVRAPQTSHLEAFRYLTGLGDDDDVLEVLFRKGKKRLYQYFAEPARKDRLEFLYLAMKEAESPGELIWSIAILEQFRYA